MIEGKIRKPNGGKPRWEQNMPCHKHITGKILGQRQPETLDNCERIPADEYFTA